MYSADREALEAADRERAHADRIDAAAGKQRTPEELRRSAELGYLSVIAHAVARLASARP